EGLTSLDGKAVIYDDTTGELVDSQTGEAISDGVTALPEEPISPLDDAFNQYYNDLYSQEEGTLGKQILNNNISLYEKEAGNAAILAETSKQSQALAQSQAVKQVTDAVRSERMAQLRAGMSESQLADRE